MFELDRKLLETRKNEKKTRKNLEKMSDLIFPVGFDGKVLFGVPTGTDHFLRFPFMKPFMNRN